MIKPVYPEQKLLTREVYRKFHHRFNAATASGEEISFWAQHPYPFYTTAFFIRLALLLMVLIISSMLCGLLYQFVGYSETATSVVCFIMGVASLALNEHLTGNKFHYASGVDDGLQLTGLAYLILFFAIVFGWNDILIALVTGVISCLIALRYLNSLMVIIALFSFGFVLYDLVFSFSPPLWCIAIAALATVFYIMLLQWSKRLPEYYFTLLLVMRYTLLVAAIAIGGYFGLFQSMVSGYPEVYIWLFTTLMFGLPLLSIAFGIRFRLRELLHTGFPGLYGAIYIQYGLRGVGYGGWWLLFTGIATVAIAVWLMQYLKKPRGGFSDLPEADHPAANIAEWLFYLETGGKQTAPAGRNYGGGDFGGGGASGNF